MELHSKNCYGISIVLQKNNSVLEICHEPVE